MNWLDRKRSALRAWWREFAGERRPPTRWERSFQQLLSVVLWFCAGAFAIKVVRELWLHDSIPGALVSGMITTGTMYMVMRVFYRR